MMKAVAPGSILQINLSRGGAPKHAVVTPLGIQGDLHAHPAVHGGPLKALLLITSEGLEELRGVVFRYSMARSARTSPRSAWTAARALDKAGGSGQS